MSIIGEDECLRATPTKGHDTPTLLTEHAGYVGKCERRVGQKLPELEPLVELSELRAHGTRGIRGVQQRERHGRVGLRC